MCAVPPQLQRQKLQPVLLRHGRKPLQQLQEKKPQLPEGKKPQLQVVKRPQPPEGKKPQLLEGKRLQLSTALRAMHATLTMELAQPQCLFLPFSCLRSSPVFCSM